MSQSIEATGPDIDSAVAEAVAQLGVTVDQVQVEILEEPSRRLLGLGTRPARVRVTLVGGTGNVKPNAAPPAPTIAVVEPHPASNVQIKPELPEAPTAHPSVETEAPVPPAETQPHPMR